MTEISTKTFSTQIEGLDPEKPNVHILVVQASNPNGSPLTEGQMDAALNAAVATLEVVGAEVGATLNALAIDPVEDGQESYLKIDVKQTIFSSRVESFPGSPLPLVATCVEEPANERAEAVFSSRVESFPGSPLPLVATCVEEPANERAEAVYVADEPTQ